jgi:pimeloyl-ACP methyl ester carboxylesterase
MRVEPFSIHVDDEVLSDLRARILATRWPDPAPGEPWAQGTDLEYLRGLLAYWADGFDWRAQERELNRFDHFRADLDGAWVHFVHHRGGGVPLVLTHGWPSAFVEQLPLVPLLEDFDLVIPSLPGYGFSERPARATTRDTARRWHRLMQGLGYERYGAGGGDFGAGVATLMALDDPEPLLGLHLTTFEVAPYTGPGSRPLTEAERAFEEQTRRWDALERGYSAIQSTRPQTVGYGLNDSPAGLAAWILEKWRSWSDSGGDVVARLGRDFVLTLVTLYWVSGTITSSMRDYYDNRWAGFTPGLQDFVRVPTAFALFDRHFVPEGTAPREWPERLYDVRRWTPMERGGHFAAAEEPELLARDIRAFFSGV